MTARTVCEYVNLVLSAEERLEAGRRPMKLHPPRGQAPVEFNLT